MRNASLPTWTQKENNLKDIPQEWINQYVDKLISAAEQFGEGAMRKTILERAEHAMDLVEAWRDQSHTEKVH
jgi:pyruvate dehydrogenase complex dehydrogenase (E1) component